MKIVRNLEYAPGRRGDLFLPETPVPRSGFPAAVLIHGGAWTSLDRRSMEGVAHFLAGSDFAVFNIDYRLAPEHRWPAGCDDCKAAAEWLVHSDHPVDKEKIFTVGASAGGHYALMAGLLLPRGTICGIVSISGIDDVFSDSRFAPGRYTALLGETPGDSRLRELNPAEHLTPDAPPILCTHCRYDEAVPFETCTAFERAVVNKGGRICVYGYDLDRRQQGHGIWIPGSSPHRLYPDLEAVISGFMKEVISK